jgi:antitoxin ParD1/3/4
MRADRSITVTISDEMRELIDRKIASGEFSDESAVVAEGLRLLDDEDMDGDVGLPEFELEGEALKTWLRREVLPVIEAHDPSKALSIDEVRRQLEEHMDARDREGRFPE